VIPSASTIVSPAYSTSSIMTTANRSPSNRRSASVLTSAAESPFGAGVSILDISPPAP
jgi:hypothetical protein